MLLYQACQSPAGIHQEKHAPFSPFDRVIRIQRVADTEVTNVGKVPGRDHGIKHSSRLSGVVSFDVSCMLGRVDRCQHCIRSNKETLHLPDYPFPTHKLPWVEQSTRYEFKGSLKLKVAIADFLMETLTSCVCMKKSQFSSFTSIISSSALLFHSNMVSFWSIM